MYSELQDVIRNRPERGAGIRWRSSPLPGKDSPKIAHPTISSNLFLCSPMYSELQDVIRNRPERDEEAAPEGNASDLHGLRIRRERVHQNAHDRKKSRHCELDGSHGLSLPLKSATTYARRLSPLLKRSVFAVVRPALAKQRGIHIHLVQMPLSVNDPTPETDRFAAEAAHPKIFRRQMPYRSSTVRAPHLC